MYVEVMRMRMNFGGGCTVHGWGLCVVHMYGYRSISVDSMHMQTHISKVIQTQYTQSPPPPPTPTTTKVFPNTPESHIPPTPATSLSSHPPGPAPPSTDAKGGPPVAHVEGTPLAALLSGDRDAVARFQDQSFEEVWVCCVCVLGLCTLGLCMLCMMVVCPI